MLRLTAAAFVLALPFCALAKPGWLGNFDVNLSLYPMLILAPLLAVRGELTAPLLMRGAEGRFVRLFAGVMAIAAVLTVFNGWWFALRAERLWTYGLDPLSKALLTAVVPLFIAVLFLASVAVARLLPPGPFQRLLVAGFWTTAGYTALQALSAVIPLPLYDALWPLLEGARDNFGISYVAAYHRLCGPTQEPAELAKLTTTLFLPWLVFPAEGRPRPLAIVVALVLVLATQSIIGLALAALALTMLLTCGGEGRGLRLALLGAAYAGVLVLLLVPGALPLTHRLPGLGADASTTVRLGYNLAALDILAENPWAGVGWSNEIYLFPERLGPVAHLSEVQGDIATGHALTARSLFLRLAMYLGGPLFLVFLAALARTFLLPRADAAPADRARARFTALLFALGATIDGGMLTSFYLWAAPAMALAYLMPREGIAVPERAPRGPAVPA